MADKWCLVDGQQFWMWFGTFTHTCTAPQGMVVGTCHLQGRQPLPWQRSPVSFGQISLSLVFRGRVETRVLPALPCPGWCIVHGRQLQMWFGTFSHSCTAPRGMVIGTCHFRGGSPYHGAGPLWILSWLAKLHFSAGGSRQDLAPMDLPHGEDNIPWRQQVHT